MKIGSGEQEDVEGVVELFEEEGDIEKKVCTTLRDHLDFWKVTGASKFMISVIENGYRPKLRQQLVDYEEGNNASYRKNKSWANQAV